MRKTLVLLLLLLVGVAVYADWHSELFGGGNPLYFNSSPVGMNDAAFGPIRQFQDALYAKAMEQFFHIPETHAPIASVSVSVQTGVAPATWYRSGGATGVDGKVYFPPFTGDTFLIYDPATDTLASSSLGLSMDSTTFKFLGAVSAGNGVIYCIPFNLNYIARIDTNYDPASATLTAMGAVLSGSSKWYGGCLAGDGKIYCTPHSAVTCLIIDPVTDTATTSALGVTMTGAAKWAGMAMGDDGRLVTAAYSTSTMLLINPHVDPPTAKITRFGLTLSSLPYLASCCSMPNGEVYFARYSTDGPFAVRTSTEVGQAAPTTGTGMPSCKAGPDGAIYIGGHTGLLKRYIPSTAAVENLPGSPASPYLWGIITASDSMMVGIGYNVSSFFRIRIGTTPSTQESATSRSPWFNNGN